jgi:hypothetical protein
MRALFLALVLINVGFFYWQYTLNGGLVPAPETSEAPQDDSVPQLRLLSEAKHKPAQGAPAGPPAKREACFLVGPFPDETEARTVVEDFAAKGVDAAYTPRPRQYKRYWLRTPTLANHKAAEAKLKQLNKMGFHDVAIMEGGDLRNSLSLGYYQNPSSAEQRIAELKAKGVKVIQEVQPRTVQAHWVRYQAPRGDAAADAVWKAVSHARPDTRREETPCQ